ncbi:MAG: hypothetical protein WAM77_01900 [Xanthobacteraceae bacterium]|jgi:hypothetical protein
MGSSADDYRKQAEDMLRWAEDCDAVATRLRTLAAELLRQAQGAGPVIQQQQQIQPTKRGN